MPPSYYPDDLESEQGWTGDPAKFPLHDMAKRLARIEGQVSLILQAQHASALLMQKVSNDVTAWRTATRGTAAIFGALGAAVILFLAWVHRVVTGP